MFEKELELTKEEIMEYQKEWKKMDDYDKDYYDDFEEFVEMKEHEKSYPDC